MPYDLRVDRRVLDYLKTLDAKPFRQIVRRVLELSENPRPHDSEQLQGIMIQMSRAGRDTGWTRESIVYSTPSTNKHIA